MSTEENSEGGDGKGWRKKKLVLIMCLKIGQVAHTDTPAPGYLALIYLFCLW